MTQTGTLLCFTAQLSELLIHGIPVRKALIEMSGMTGSPKLTRRLSLEAALGIEDGRTFSAVLSSCELVRFPHWYTAFVAAAEENGCLSETLAFLARTLEVQRKSLVSFALAVVYPALVMLSCFACAVWACRSFPHFFAGENSALSPFVTANLFLLGVVFFAVFLLCCAVKTNPCISLMNALGFLTAKGTPLSRSLEYALPVVEQNEKLCNAVLSIRGRLLHGEPAGTVFFEQLEEAGFSYAAHAVSMQLSLAQSGGGKNVFEQTAAQLSGRADRVRSSLLSCEQPVLLCCAAIYMMLLLKDSIMPFLLGTGI